MKAHLRRCFLALLLFFSVPLIAADVDPFNYGVGTQAIGGAYQFTEDTRLVESAKRIHEMGSNILKFAMSPEGAFGKDKGNVPVRDPAVLTLLDLATKEPSHKAVLDMPFAYYFIWMYPLSVPSHAGIFKPEDRDKEYHEVYDFVCHLLKTYSGTGKHFYLGHWEGDWHLRPHSDPKQPIPEGFVEHFTDWLRIRQQAVDDAKRDTPHHDVWVWQYTEVNLVQPFLKGGECLTNSVLPNVDIDYVSYSSYDSLKKNIPADLSTALSYIESKLRPRPGIEGKRVFIGEYGFPQCSYSAQEQNLKSLQTMHTALEWGCPFVLYWELYCNEIKDGKHAGFWLIDDQNVKQPVWNSHERFLRESKAWVTAFSKEHQRSPQDQEFRAQALLILDGITKDATAKP